ncbi:zinc ribbon domain-containing protein [Amycolatopsis sp. NPDC023774]|uniref:zinc ribbon domain-containing protein n=1 Tax=Amycolatopsis sp. NPDC023774 TaxID=3155015 RepID=UPI0033E62665
MHSTPALSVKPAHPALVTEQDFVTAQQIRAPRPTKDGGVRRFALAGLVHCGVCDRRLDSHWNHGRPTYRCRTVTSSSSPSPPTSRSTRTAPNKTRSKPATQKKGSS